MDAFTRSCRAHEPRSGGKILRPRRTASARTPYDRPTPSIDSAPQENPNWLARILYPPTRLLATGAGKLLSSVFSQESSSSSSSEDEDASSEDEIDAENDENVISFPEAGWSEKKDEMSEMVLCLAKESQPTIWKSETKRVIEQLVMHEAFSREEYERLINILKARVVDYHIMEDTNNGRINETPNRVDTNDVELPDLCSTAVREAKKWLEKQKLEAFLKSDCKGSGTYNSVMLPYVTEGLLGSPVDVAKSYMRARPPWASPSTSHIELNTPSPAGMQLFKEETPPLLGGNFASSSKLKKDSLASGSWNIVDEIRKVRSKATEEMLRSPSSRRMDSPSFALESKIHLNILEADQPEEGLGNKNHNSTKIIDASSVAGLTSHLAIPVLEMTQDGLDEVLPCARANFISQSYQVPEAARIIEEQGGLQERLGAGKLRLSEDTKVALTSDDGAGDFDGLKDTNGTKQELCSLGETTKVPMLDGRNCVISKEVAVVGDASGANGFAPLASRFSAGLDKEQNGMPFDEEHNPMQSSNDEMVNNKTCELLSEAYMEVPVNEIGSVVSDSSNCSSLHYDNLVRNTAEPDLKQSLHDKKQPQRKNPSRYSRRGRG